MTYSIPWSSGTQIAVGVGINVLALLLLWGPFFVLKRKYRNEKEIPLRARLITFGVFVVFFVLFWLGYSIFYKVPIGSHPGLTYRDLPHIDTFLSEVIGFLSLPMYTYLLVKEYNGKCIYIVRVLAISGGFLLSFIAYIALIIKMGVRVF